MEKNKAQAAKGNPADVGNDTATLGARFGIDAVIQGLAADLKALREGKLAPRQAEVHALLAKQYFQGIRQMLAAQRFLEDHSRLLPSPPAEVVAAASGPEIIPPKRRGRK